MAQKMAEFLRRSVKYFKSSSKSKLSGWIRFIYNYDSRHGNGILMLLDSSVKQYLYGESAAFAWGFKIDLKEFFSK